AMVGCLKAAGGELLLGRPVETIDQSDGRTASVRLSGGERLIARRAVIANLDPRLVFGKLVAKDERRAAFDAKVARFRSGPGTMMIHLALTGLPDWKAGAQLQRCAYVPLAPGYQVMSAAYTEAMSGLLPREPVLVVGQPTAIDPSRAPAGRHVLWVQVRVLPSRILGDAAGEIRAGEWDEVKEIYADRVIRLTERYAPGLRSHILARAVLSPDDLERDNPNLVGGDSVSGSHHLDQNFLFRPAFGWSRYRTPITRLFMVGASTWPGAGT